MSKLSYEDKIEIHKKKKQGSTKIALAKEYDVSILRIDYIYRIIEKHGYDILRKNRNKYYPPYQKERIINRILVNGESITSVAIDEGLHSYGMLLNGLKNIKKTVII